jgi:hypothetical protein
LPEFAKLFGRFHRTYSPFSDAVIGYISHAGEAIASKKSGRLGRLDASLQEFKRVEATLAALLQQSVDRGHATVQRNVVDVVQCASRV